MGVTYYGSKISDNMSKTPEGMLICHNVPIARIGSQTYKGYEVHPDLAADDDIEVNRTLAQVFSPATIASFEGKPITDNHPSKGIIDINDFTSVARGHAQNVRQQDDNLIADLFVTDPGLIHDIENKRKREVSCGYNVKYVEGSDGSWEQQEIRGNHIAIVPRGRAGESIAIQDASPKKIETIERSKNKMSRITLKSLLGLGMKEFAKDATPEEMAEAAGVIGDEEPAAEATEQVEAGQNTQMLEMMQDIITRLTALEQSDKQVHAETTDEGEEVLADLEKETGDAESEFEEKPTEDEEFESGIIEPEQTEDEDPEFEEKPTGDAYARDLIQKMKPIILGISDPSERAFAAKRFAAAVRDSKPKGANGYATIQKAITSHKVGAVDSGSMSTRAQQFCDNAKKMIPHNNKGGNV